MPATLRRGRATNAAIAQELEHVADLLEAQDANPFRVRAWRRGAETVRRLQEPVGRILARGGTAGLEALPAIGRSLARTIEELAHTGRLALGERLRGQSEPEVLLATVPGIGRELAHRVHEELGIETLPDLEVAAWDGRLDAVAGFGPGRLRAVQESLAGRFRRGSGHLEAQESRDRGREPSVRELLDIDREYREQAVAGRLVRIAPQRFNPLGEAWLPVLHTHRGEHHYTALWSNTARAHQLGTTHDWVVIYRDDHGDHGRWTVVTETGGPLRGQRVVRGREVECTELAAGS